ncbi:helix-turn-helix domain-containing protein, partial [Enterococcus avium]
VMEIGNNLKEKRREKGFTIEELSKRSGVSGITISNIENHKSNPTVIVLWKLSQALDVVFTTLFAAKKNELLTVSKLNDHYFMPDSNNNWFVEPIYHLNDLEIYRVKLKAKSSYTTVEQSNNSIEIVTLMSKSLKLIINNSEYQVNQFESISFNGSQPHTYINETDEEIFLNIVVKYRYL